MTVSVMIDPVHVHCAGVQAGYCLITGSQGILFLHRRNTEVVVVSHEKAAEV